MITLENKKLKVLISEGRGARIEQFFDKEKNKDWVWRPLDIDTTQSSLDLELSDGFDENWAGGWEEIFPNDAETALGEFELADRGEAWRRSWTLEEKKSNGLGATFSFNCQTYPVLLRKRFSLDDTRPWLHLEYEMYSRSEKELPYIFKFHPAISIEPGDEFKMPDSTMEPVSLDFSRMLYSDSVAFWPEGEGEDNRIIRIDRAQPNDSYSQEFVKLSGFARGECGVVSKKSTSSLSFEFNKEIFPYIWLFQSYGGYMDHYVAMIEPTNAGHFDLGEAQLKNQCGKLLPGQRKTFILTIKLSTN